MMQSAWAPAARLSSAGMIVAALAGCASLAPPYEAPPLPVPESVGDANAAGAVQQAPAEIDWRRFYADDPRLVALIERALAGNRDLRVSILNIEAAQATYRIQRADRVPTINGALTGTFEPGANGSQTRVYSVGLAVSGYELDLFGRVRNLSEAALAQYLATAEARRATQLSLIGSVAAIHYSRVADDELLRLAEDTLKTRQSTLDLIRLQFQSGVASELDVRAAESLVESAKVAASQYRAQRVADDNALMLLLGAPLPPDLPGPVALGSVPESLSLPSGLPSTLLLRRPDVLQAEQGLRAANANIGAARAALLPRITLTGSAGVASDELSGLFTSGRFAWTATPQLIVPLFDAGRGRANVEVAEVRQRIAVAQYEQAIQSAFRDVADAINTRAALAEQAQSQQALETAESERLRLTELRFRYGVASTLDLLDAQRSTFGVRQTLVQNRLARAQNRATLYKVMGGGWAPSDEAAASAAATSSTASAR